MTKFLVALLMVVSSFAMMHSDAEAKRIGGGGSVGKQSPNVTRQQAPAQPAANQVKPATPAAAPAATPKPASPWKGMLGGALLGLG